MQGSRIELLIVEDCSEDVDFLESLLQAARDERYVIRIAANIAEARRAVGLLKPDCILLDYRLPDQDGLSFLRHWMQDREGVNIPVILMTGTSGFEHYSAALHHGAQDFLPKAGLTTDILQRTIRHAIVRFRLMQEREAAMTMLAERERLLRIAQESAGIGTFDLNWANGTIRAGGAYFAMHGFLSPPACLSFDQWLARMHPEDSQRFKLQTEESVAGAHDFSYEYRVTWPDGTLHWILARGGLTGGSGEPLRLMGINVDITAVKKAEEALVAANLELQQFAFTAGHDLQAPLRTVNIFTELLQQSLGNATDQNVQQALHHIRNGAQRMQILVADLLHFAESGAPISMTLQKVQPLDDALCRALENLHSDIRASGAVVTSDPLPEVHTGSHELVQVFQNLIGNAIKYRRRDTALQIHVTCVRRTHHWLVSVRDNGEGFEMSSAALVFEPFKRLVGREIAGSGLGLPICKRIIERLGGEIWAESRPGQGATFSFTLPCVDWSRKPDVAKAHCACD